MPYPYRIALLALGVLLLAAAPLRAQQGVLVKLEDLEPRRLRAGGFELPAPAELHVHAVGAGPDRRVSALEDADAAPWVGNAWILDARRREVVWELRGVRTASAGRGLREYQGALRLPAGVYEVYFAAFPSGYWNEGAFGELAELGAKIADAIDEALGVEGEETERVPRAERVERDAFGAMKIEIRGAGRPMDEAEIERLHEALRADAPASLTPVRDEERAQVGLLVERAVEVEVLALGEGRDGELFDHGWIADARTNRPVWRMTFDRTEPAGGAVKNRVVRQRVTLQPGRYTAAFVTDDSHAPGSWNAAPPHDPAFWGLTLRLADEADRPFVRVTTSGPPRPAEALAALVGLGSQEDAARGFVLREPAELRIYALGEGRDGEMFDYGWIAERRTGRRVWQMRYEETAAAGGDGKNRLFDGVVRLEPGEYVAHFVTDDSHAYGDWNAAPPPEGRLWGLTIAPVEGAAPAGEPAAFDPDEDPAALARITRVRNDARERERFALDDETQLRVVALGEGVAGRMLDYGWIEDERTKRIVWEMRYEDTEHAGGAHKNRVVEDVIVLPAGEYALHFVTDDTHAYGRWNDDAPPDPDAWGIRVQRLTAR